MGNTGNSQIEN